MVNYLAVFVTTIICFAITYIWYSPFMFYKKWAKLTNVKEMKISFLTVFVGFLFMLIMNFVLAIVISYSNFNSFFDGAVIGILLWFGFVASILLNVVLYEKKSFELFFINSIPYLISLFINGGIIAVWR